MSFTDITLLWSVRTYLFNDFHFKRYFDKYFVFDYWEMHLGCWNDTTHCYHEISNNIILWLFKVCQMINNSLYKIYSISKSYANENIVI